MTDNQKIAYEWAKSHDYPSIAARYARELAGLVDDLQGAYDAMVRDLTARTRQVRQLQGEISALRQQEHFREVTKKVEPLTLEELRQMDGEPVWVQFLHNKIGYWYLIDCHNSEFIRFYRSGFFINGEYSKSFLAYRQKPEEDDHA